MADDPPPKPSFSRTSSQSDDPQRPRSAAADTRESVEPPSPDSVRRRTQQSQQQQQQTVTTYGTDISASQTVSTETQPTPPRRSSFARRSSSKQLPQKGQGFSVDDDVDEVDEDKRRLVRVSSSGSTRRPSALKRRPTWPQPMTQPEEPVIDEVVEEEETPSSMTPDITQPADTRTEERRVRILSESSPETSPADNEDDDLSDAESFTLKDRQEAINETHPFGIRIWKPALYKKSRSVEKNAEGDIHSTPGGFVSTWLWLSNFSWTILFGWWLALVSACGGLFCYCFAFVPGCSDYGRVLMGLARYILYPFGKYVKLVQEDAYAAEDEGEGRSVTEYEQWQSGDLEEGRLFFGPSRSLIGSRRDDVDSEDDETTSLLGRTSRARRRSTKISKSSFRTKTRLFGRGKWNFGRIVFFLFFYWILSPCLLLVSGVCWLAVFPIPMARVCMILFDHLRRRPLALEFHSDTSWSRDNRGTATSAILLCTYRAVGLKYWKYTIDGTNVILLNLLAIVAFVIFDFWVFKTALGLQIWLTNPVFLFLLSLFSIIPLAYFIGQAVASISAQSTMGVGAAINAFFSTVVEVFLYCVALREGKAQLVEGSIVGSIFAGILFLPGLSMCFGAIHRKTQRFNVRSAGVTTTMLLFAVIGAFGPTLFYKIYGAHELNCMECISDNPEDRDCQRCFFAQVPAMRDPFFTKIIQPYVWFSAFLLFLSYLVGLLFTLRTHAATIWNAEIEEKKAENSPHPSSNNPHFPPKPAILDFGPPPSKAGSNQNSSARPDIRESELYKRILKQSLRQHGIITSSPKSDRAHDGKLAVSKPSEAPNEEQSRSAATSGPHSPTREGPIHFAALTEEESRKLAKQMAQMAATAAALTARDVTHARDMMPANPRKLSSSDKRGANHHSSSHKHGHDQIQGAIDQQAAISVDTTGATATPTHTPTPASGGHDAPNWSRSKSCIVLLTATVAYAIIAEILVHTVDSVLNNTPIDQKFLGITLFALVPNTTEFLNAISFAINGNIALSMEIGSAYALQVCLLQIPALVLFSAVYGRFIDVHHIVNHTFNMVFPQWDMVTTILCVFLLSYMYGEGKSNYFKGSILILSYLVVVVGFYLSGFNNIDVQDPNGPGRHHGAGFAIMAASGGGDWRSSGKIEL